MVVTSSWPDLCSRFWWWQHLFFSGGDGGDSSEFWNSIGGVFGVLGPFCQSFNPTYDALEGRWPSFRGECYRWLKWLFCFEVCSSLPGTLDRGSPGMSSNRHCPFVEIT